MRFRPLALLCAAFTTLACAGEKGELTAILPPSETLGNVTASPTAMILAVGGTRQLTFTATSLTGTPVAQLDTVMYLLNTPADSTLVKVDANGLVTALKVAPLVRINVVAKRDGVFKGDQVLVQVTATAVASPVLSIQPADSTRLASGSLKTMTPTVTSVTSPVVRYSVRPADAKRVVLHRPFITVGGFVITLQGDPSPAPAVNQIGAADPEAAVWVYGTVDAYGTVLRDSVLMTLTYPFTMTFPVGRNATKLVASTANQTMTLAPGATLTFQSTISATTDPQLRLAFTFDNPAAATAATPASTTGGSTGNVTPLNGGQTSRRRFLTAGTYTWTATASGTPAMYAGQSVSGTIVIK